MYLTYTLLCIFLLLSPIKADIFWQYPQKTNASIFATFEKTKNLIKSVPSPQSIQESQVQQTTPFRVIFSEHYTSLQNTLNRVFSVIDSDENGSITEGEMIEYVNKANMTYGKLPPSITQGFELEFKLYDLDGSGQVSFYEFYKTVFSELTINFDFPGGNLQVCSAVNDLIREDQIKEKQHELCYNGFSLYFYGYSAENCILKLNCKSDCTSLVSNCFKNAYGPNFASFDPTQIIQPGIVSTKLH